MREERRGGGALLFTSYKRNCVFEFSSGIFRQIFAIFSKIDRTKRRSKTIIRARTNPWTDGWTGKGCFVTGRPLGFADASGVAARGKQRRGVIGGERERERYDVPEAKYP